MKDNDMMCEVKLKEQEDLEIMAESDIDFEKYRDCRVLITGATGLVGSHLAKAFLFCSKKKDLNIHVIALVRNKDKAKKVYKTFEDYENLEIFESDIKEYVEYKQNIDYIFHAASITTSKVMVEEPVKTIETAYQGTKNILDLAVQKKVKSVVYISSMEVYGIPDKELKMVTEKDLGYIDVYNVRSSYSEGKRICECLCNAYVSQYHLPIKVARLAQTFGAGIMDNDNRVYAQFARSVINKKDIVLHSDGTSEGNYCYIRDTIEALMILALKGKMGEAYNIVNEETHMQIREMAEMVADKVAKKEICVIYDIPENEKMYGYAPSVRMKLSGEKMRKLGWNPKVNLQEAYERMIEDMMKVSVV